MQQNSPNKAMANLEADDQRVPLRNTQIICPQIRWHLLEDFCCTQAVKPIGKKTNEKEQNEWQKERRNPAQIQQARAKCFDEYNKNDARVPLRNTRTILLPSSTLLWLDSRWIQSMKRNETNGRKE